MWRQWLHALRARNGGRFSCLAAVEKNFTVLAAANEVTPTLDVSDAAPAMSVKRDDLSSRNGGTKHANAVVFQQDRMMFRGGDDGIERIGPGPAFR